jgi:hypothetical protein
MDKRDATSTRAAPPMRPMLAKMSLSMGLSEEEVFTFGLLQDFSRVIGGVVTG